MYRYFLVYHIHQGLSFTEKIWQPLHPQFWSIEAAGWRKDAGVEGGGAW